MSSQLSLPIFLRDEATFDNFYVVPECRMLVQQLQTLAERGLSDALFLWGGGGVGKSHLIQACCHSAKQSGRLAQYLPLHEVKDFSAAQVLDSLECASLICLDDVHSVAEDPAWEEALFHFFNRCKETSTTLVMTSGWPPNNLNIQLADLKSRLLSGLVFGLPPLLDEQKMEAFCFRAELRGIRLANDVKHYLLTHALRDTAFLFEFLDKLDVESLALQRKVTVPFLKQLLIK